MNHFRLARTLILVAGSASAAMGAFHFFLPGLFGWGRFTDALPAEIRWALYAINAFFSLLLLAGGLASMAPVRDPSADAIANWPAWTMTVFWVFNTAYQLAWPFPAPRIRWVLIGFALAVTILYAAGLYLGRRGLRRGQTV
jgi:hypothetical protein